MADSGGWNLEDFDVLVDAWVAKAQPDQDLINEVFSWLQSRIDNPTYAMDPQDEPNLYLGRVPNTVRGGTVVKCAFVVDEDRHVLIGRSLETRPLDPAPWTWR